MNTLTVLYDGACPFCERCRDFLVAARQRVPLRLLDCRSIEAQRRFGRIPGLGRELVVVDDTGRFWIGPAAFVMCLWALDDGRVFATFLLFEPLRPLTIALFTWLSNHRGTVTPLFGLPECVEGHCGLAHEHSSPYR